MAKALFRVLVILSAIEFGKVHISDRFSHYFNKVNNFCDIIFAFLYTQGYSKRKDFAFQVENSFLLEEIIILFIHLLFLFKTFILLQLHRKLN